MSRPGERGDPSVSAIALIAAPRPRILARRLEHDEISLSFDRSKGLRGRACSARRGQAARATQAARFAFFANSAAHASDGRPAKRSRWRRSCMTVRARRSSLTRAQQPALAPSPQPWPAPTARALPPKTLAQGGQNWTPIRGQIWKPIDNWPLFDLTRCL
jgi:hypothetical protein